MVKKRRVLQFTKDKVLQETEEIEKPKGNDKESKGKFLALISLTSELGFSISLPIVGGAILGQFLDEKLHTNPKMTLSLIFLGLFIGVANIYILLKDSREE